MTRWSIRRRSGADRGAAQAYRPGEGAPAGGPPPTAQPQASQPAGEWAAAGWSQPGWPQPGQAGWPEASQPHAGHAPDGQPATGLAAVGLLAEPAPRRPAAQPGWDTQAGDRQQEQPPPRQESAWPDICDQFGLHLLVLAEQLRASLDELEADEGNPDRLQRLYQVDHAITRMRRASRDLRTLAGRSEEELAGFTTSLLDIIRMAASAIERYTQVSIGRVTDLAVLGYAADDVGSLIAALLDNATRYSPGTVTVSGHLLEDGAVMFRIEDTGIGMDSEQIAQLNAGFAGPIPEVDERTGRHTGFPVVHRIARKHSIRVRLTSRPSPSAGTVAMVALPPHLLCEVPADDAQHRPAPSAKPAQREPGARPTAVPDLARRDRPGAAALQRAAAAALAAGPDRDAEQAAGEPDAPGDLPRRERASLRGDEPRRAGGPAPAPALSAEQQAAARRAFATDLGAFSQGSTGSPGSTGIPPDNGETAGETAVDARAVSGQGSVYQEGTVP